MILTRFYIRLARDITPYVRMRGIYCKGREGCIIQRITIVGIHDNNCTIIITAARAINRGWVHGSLYDGPIICRRWKPPRPPQVLEFCPLNHSRGRATSVQFGGRLSWLLSRLSLQRTNVLQRCRKIQACTLLYRVTSAANTTVRRSDTNQRSARAPFHCVKPFITT